MAISTIKISPSRYPWSKQYSIRDCKEKTAENTKWEMKIIPAAYQEGKQPSRGCDQPY